MKITYQSTRAVLTDTSMVVALSDLKKHVAIDGSETYYNDMLTGMHDAAVEYLESRSRVTFRNSQWEVYASDLPCNRNPFYLPVWPVRSIQSVTYMDETGNSQTPAYQSVLHTSPAAIYPAIGEQWQRTQEDNVAAVAVFLTGGYANNAAIPAQVKHAVKLLVAHWFRNRETVLIGTISKDLEKAVDALLVQFRRNFWQPFGMWQ